MLWNLLRQQATSILWRYHGTCGTAYHGGLLIQGEKCAVFSVDIGARPLFVSHGVVRVRFPILDDQSLVCGICYSNTSLCVLRYRKYHVTITENELSFGYSSGCMQVCFDRSCVLEAEEIANVNGFCEWGGYGIRKQLPSWDTGYIARNGPAVRVRVKLSNGKETNYTFSCHDPAEVVRILTN
jgi:hypothetical protein